MNDYELYCGMRKIGFTEKGAINCLEVKNRYSALYAHYDEYMGNFGFNQKDVESLMPLILEWIKEHDDYVLLYSDDNYESGYVWWLTTEY